MAKNKRQNPPASSDGAERVASSAELGDDHRLDLSLRRHSLGEFVGQEKLKRVLGMSITAARQRGEIQAKILKLNKEREQYLAAERKKQLGTKADTLDKAIVKAVREQAAHHNFKFE